MKVAFTSDLHVDISERNRDAVAEVSELVRRGRPEVVVIAGDAGNSIGALEEVLSYFRDIDTHKLFVPGNHDVWIESAGGELIDSRSKFEELIPSACRQAGFIDLGRAPAVIGDVGFVGSIGWYDYSFADERLGLGEDDYWRGRYGDEIWWDRKMTYWIPTSSGGADVSGRSGPKERMRDPEVCREMVARLDKDIQSIEGRVKTIVVVVHTLPFFVGIPRSQPPCYLDAYTGSARLGEVLKAHPKIEHCIHGHKHTCGEWTAGGLRLLRRTLGRIGEDEDLGERAREAVGSIEM